MSHPHDQAPAPLTAEVVAMVKNLKTYALQCSDALSPSAELKLEAADMLTALATQLAERDAELARVTADNLRFEITVSNMDDAINAATARIAALTEAGSNVLPILDALVADSGRDIPYDAEDPFRMGEWFEATDIAAIETLRTALTTDKGSAS